MRDRMYYFLLGFMLMTIISMIIISYNPTPNTEVVCGGCGGKLWYSVIASDE